MYDILLGFQKFTHHHEEKYFPFLIEFLTNSFLIKIRQTVKTHLIIFHWVWRVGQICGGGGSPKQAARLAECAAVSKQTHCSLFYYLRTYKYHIVYIFIILLVSKSDSNTKQETIRRRKWLWLQVCRLGKQSS